MQKEIMREGSNYGATGRNPSDQIAPISTSDGDRCRRLSDLLRSRGPIAEHVCLICQTCAYFDSARL
jgi:hypothetical protein